MVTVPVPVRLTVEPLKVAGPDTMAKVTARPLLAVAESVNGVSPKTLLGRGLKVIVDGVRTTPEPVAVKLNPLEFSVK